jgi:hypothetical protein
VIRRWGGVPGPWMALVLLVGCPQDDREPPSEPSEVEGPLPASEAQAPADMALAVPSATAWRTEGEGAERRRIPVAPGEAVGGEASATVDVRGGGRFEVAPGAQAHLGGVPPPPLLLGRGRARARLGPTGPPDRAPLRLGTPEVTVELVRGGDVFAVALADGRTWVVALAGDPVLLTGAAADQGGARRWPLAAGQGVWVTGEGPGEPAAAPSRAREVEAAMDVLAGKGSPGRDVGTQARADAALEEALVRLERERARGRALAAAHRQAVADDAARATEIRKQIVEHTKALVRLRGLVRTRWERLAALEVALGAASEGAAARNDRVQRALVPRP